MHLPSLPHVQGCERALQNIMHAKEVVELLSTVLVTASKDQKLSQLSGIASGVGIFAFIVTTIRVFEYIFTSNTWVLPSIIAGVLIVFITHFIRGKIIAYGKILSDEFQLNLTNFLLKNFSKEDVKHLQSTLEKING